MDENALHDVKIGPYIHSDHVSENVIQQDNMHTTTLTLADRVYMDTLGMDTHSIDHIDTQTRNNISKLDLMDITAVDLDCNQDYFLRNILDEHIGLRMEDTVYPVMQDVVQQRILLQNTVNSSTGPAASTSFSNEFSSAHQIQSLPWPLHDSSNYATMGLADHITPAISGITPAPFLSEMPWTPVPFLQVDAQFCISDDTLSSKELSSERRLSSTSLPVRPSNSYLYASSAQPTHSSRPLQPVAVYEEQNVAPNLVQSSTLGSQVHLTERPAGTTRRWSCSSYLSAPGNMENTAPSPTPSEVSVTPSTFPDVLLCPVEGCKAQFTGLYRRGNQRRHIRLIHSTVEYPCAVPDCCKTFNRQDARLKHHRKHHASEIPSLKPPSKRKSRKST
jgi:hypothetical protein